MNKVIFLFFLILVTGCASILSGKKQLITIDSNVKGAEILLGKEKIGVTPFTDKVYRDKAKKAGRIVVKADGYSDKVHMFDTGFKGINVLFWINLLSGGSTGMSTDYSTGAMWEIAPNHFYIELIKVGAVKADLTRHKKIVQVKNMIFNNFGKIQKELTGESQRPYTESLINLIDSDKKIKDKIQKTLNKLIQENESPIHFAKRVVEEFKL